MFTQSEQVLIANLGVYGIWLLKHGKYLEIGEQSDDIQNACIKWADYFSKQEPEHHSYACILFDTIDKYCFDKIWEKPRGNYEDAFKELKEIRKNQKSLHAYMEECERLNTKIDELKEELNALKAAVNKDVWYWQGDGEDYPESLTCHVVMTASTLRELLRNKNVPTCDC